ncbi:DUF4142 domain-containing protein [Paradesertivirga mongoliensis]|uniref:DUF4142 domain-containing protein n=1 Tax=Paradesertivirga mongoliensis TaxID=2100740 RepID=A0ABW4ZN30_9SPHI|nr:DUF4142 domain-containing protein [Pedobacter mongoliensis]
MKQFTLLFTILVAGMSVLQSCKKDRDPDFLMSNQEFVTQASSSHMLEIDAGNLAANDATSDTVKRYGTFLAQSHTAAFDELETLATQKGLTILSEMNDLDQNNYDVLDNSNAEQFDRNFLYLMLLSHQDTYSLYYNASRPNGVPDPQLRAWAAQKLESIEEHFDEAQELYGASSTQ